MNPTKWTLAAALLLVGCMSSGTQVDPAKAARFRSGVTTSQEVVAALGPPNGDAIHTDGSRTMVYVYMHSQVRPETFIPIIGGFVGGADAQTQTVSYSFDRNGVMQSGSSGQSQAGAGMLH